MPSNRQLGEASNWVRQRRSVVVLVAPHVPGRARVPTRFDAATPVTRTKNRRSTGKRLHSSKTDAYDQLDRLRRNYAAMRLSDAPLDVTP
jgi:hypothetical protein